MTKAPEGFTKEDIATYVMARSDSTLVAQLTTALQNRARVQNVLLLSGDPFVRNLVRDLLQIADITPVDKTESGASGQTSGPMPTISVPQYMRRVGPGRVAFNDCWDRPMIVAQAIGEALQSSHVSTELRLGSAWLWWAMSYRKWRDIDNLRDFVFWSLELALARGSGRSGLAEVMSEFDKNGQLERLFTVDVDPNLQYFPPFEGREPEVQKAPSRFESEMGLQSTYSLMDSVNTNWDFYALSAIDEIAYCILPTEGLRNDILQEYIVHPQDSLPFLEELAWWEAKLGEKERDDLSGVFESDWGRVQVYCRSRWSNLSEAKLAKLVKLTVKDLRRWRSEMHLETDFGGKLDGYERWVSARERLGVADLVISDDFRRFAVSGHWDEIGDTMADALKEIYKAGEHGVAWTESKFRDSREYGGYPKLFRFNEPLGSRLKMLLDVTKRARRSRYRVKSCVRIVSRPKSRS